MLVRSAQARGPWLYTRRQVRRSRHLGCVHVGRYLIHQTAACLFLFLLRLWLFSVFTLTHVNFILFLSVVFGSCLSLVSFLIVADVTRSTKPHPKHLLTVFPARIVTNLFGGRDMMLLLVALQGVSLSFALCVAATVYRRKTKLA